jgi:hypothetical protein
LESSAFSLLIDLPIIPPLLEDKDADMLQQFGTQLPQTESRKKSPAMRVHPHLPVPYRHCATPLTAEEKLLLPKEYQAVIDDAGYVSATLLKRPRIVSRPKGYDKQFMNFWGAGIHIGIWPKVDKMTRANIFDENPLSSRTRSRLLPEDCAISANSLSHCCHFEHLGAASCPFDWDQLCRLSLTTRSKDITSTAALSFDMLYHQGTGGLGLLRVCWLLLPTPAIAASHLASNTCKNAFMEPIDIAPTELEATLVEPFCCAFSDTSSASVG